jgi:hypothetical protein
MRKKGQNNEVKTILARKRRDMKANITRLLCRKES